MAVLTSKCVGETCMICDEQGIEGIHICDQLICDSCQKEILETDVTDKKYDFYLERLSRLSIKVNKAVESRHS